MYAGIAIITALGLGLNADLLALERLLAPWNR
jgi:hypothetical protein